MRLLDLYCSEGLGAWGYWNSGRFSEIVGVDVDPEMSTRYSFNFRCQDVLTLDYAFLMGFDFIHASPPCQAYSKVTPKKAKQNHKRLITETHHMLHAVGVPYVIENVEGSGIDLHPNLVINGHYCGLQHERRRYFYVSVFESAHRWISNGAAANVHGGFNSRERMIELMGLGQIPYRALSKITVNGIKQGIPPEMTKRISECIIAEKFYI